MKPIYIFLFSLLAFATSCEEIDDISFSDVQAPIGITFTVASADSAGFTEEQLDASTNSDFMTNRSKIDQMEITDILYTVESLGVGAADSVIAGTVEYYNPATSAYEVIGNINNKKLVLNLPYQLQTNKAVLDKVVSAFKTAPYQAKLRLNAGMNKKPVDFTMELTVKLKLKVKL